MAAKKQAKQETEWVKMMREKVFASLAPMLPKLITWGKSCASGSQAVNSEWKVKVGLAVVPSVVLSFDSGDGREQSFALDRRFLDEMASHQQEALLFIQVLTIIRKSIPEYDDWKVITGVLNIDDVKKGIV